MNNEFEGLFASQGWQCPLCKRVYSPYTPMCYYCGNGQRGYTFSDGTIQIDSPDGKLRARDLPGYVPHVEDRGNSTTAPNDVPITK